MSDFKINDINKLQDFANMIGTVLEYWFSISQSSGSSGGSSPTSPTGPAGGCRALDSVLVPDPNKLLPNMGQLKASGDLSQFYDAIDLYRSYNDARRALVGDPGELLSPTSSSLAAFVDGLMHLQATAVAIYQNYDAASQDDKLGIDQVSALLNAPPTQPTLPTG